MQSHTLVHLQDFANFCSVFTKSLDNHVLNELQLALNCIQSFVAFVFSLSEILLIGLQCFDAVGWAAGRASGL